MVFANAPRVTCLRAVGSLSHPGPDKPLAPCLRLASAVREIKSGQPATSSIPPTFVMKLSCARGLTVAVVGGLCAQGINLYDCDPIERDLMEGDELHVHASIHCSPYMVRDDPHRLD